MKRLSASYLARRIDSTGRRPLPARLYQAEAEFSGCSAIRCASGFSNCSKTGPSRCDLLAEIDIEPSSLSQQLAVLRRSGIVTATRHGTAVVYALACGDVAELMRAARRILTEMLAGQNQLLAGLRESLAEPA